MQRFNISYKSFLITLSIALAVLAFLLSADIARYRETDTLQKNTLIGSYVVDDSSPTAIPQNNDLLVDSYHTVVFSGHFTEPILVNQQMIFRIDNVRFTLLVNGDFVCNFGQKKDLPAVADSAGNLWHSCISPGITPEDHIEITIENVYIDHVSSTYKSFLNNFYYGYESSLIIDSFYLGAFNFIFSIILISFALLAIATAFLLKKLPVSQERIFLFAGLCISSGIWGGMNFYLINYLFPLPIFNNALDILSLLFTMFFILSYIKTYLKLPFGRKLIHVFASITLLTIFATSLMQITGIADYYEALPFIQPFAFIFAPLTIFAVVREVRSQKNPEIQELYWSSIILGIGISLDAFGNFFDIFPYVFWFKISYLIFIILQFINLARFIQTLFIAQARLDLLEELAYRDSLTQVHNRTAYNQKIEKIIELANITQTWAVWVFDINNLKRANDLFGHEAGDLLIQASAAFLQKQFAAETIYRIGGDEFVVLYQIEDALAHQTQLTHILANLAAQQGASITPEITFSLAAGFAEFTTTTPNGFTTAFTQADAAMYLMKQQLKDI